MLDCYNRNINYLRVSVTDRCNLRCQYCMPESGIRLLRHEDILSFEEIEKVVRAAVAMGIDKVRITGGEPLVRKGIAQLIGMIARIEGIRDLALTTNGQLLETFAQPLADAGLHRVNISLDTIDESRYRILTRGGELRNVVRGIIAAKKAGLQPIKLNCVIEEFAGEPDAEGVKFFADQMGLEVRFIHRMNLHQGTFGVVEGGTGGDCAQCNRLRLTADGKIKPCLFNNLEYDIRSLGITEALRLALQNKPENGIKNDTGEFYNIGG